VDLLQHPDVKIKLISEKSRNGVVMEMIVPSKLSPFRDIDDNGEEYPIVRIICKFVLVNKNLNTYKNKVNDEYEVHRETVTHRELNQESKNLSELFNFSYQIPPTLCPAPIAEGVFNINTESIVLLELIKEKLGSDAVHLLELLMYAISEKNTRTQLGYIVMSHVEQRLDVVTYSLRDMYNHMRLNTVAINELMAEVHFTFARLLFVHGIMNCDAHSGNILVTLISQSPPKFKCMLIDMQEKRDISAYAYERLQTEYNKLLENQPDKKKKQTDEEKAQTDEEKIGFMRKVIDEYSSIARIYRKVKYRMDDPGIDWIKWYIKGESVQLLNAANKLMTLNVSLRYLPDETITFNTLPTNSTLSSSLNKQSLSSDSESSMLLESDFQPPTPPSLAAKSAAAPPLAPPHLATKSTDSESSMLLESDFQHPPPPSVAAKSAAAPPLAPPYLATKSTALLPPAPPPSTRSKRPLEPDDDKSNKRRRGGKSKRTRRAKPKKRRTIKRRNTLKR
jgi:hypothetical protein